MIMPPKQYFKTKLPVDTFVCNHTSFIVVVVVIFFIIFFSFHLFLSDLLMHNLFGKQLQKHCTQTQFFSLYLRSITLIFASNFNLSTICQNNLAQDHPPWIFFFFLFFSLSLLSLNLQMVPIQRAMPQVTPICSTKFPQPFKSN